jgi:RHS repeat-associated protein
MRNNFLKGVFCRFFFSLLVLAPGRLRAQFEEGQASQQTNTISCNQALPSVPNALTYSSLGEANKTIRNIVRLKINEVALSTATGTPLLYYNSGFTANVTLKIELWLIAPAPGVNPDLLQTPVLTVNYDPAGGNKYVPIDNLLLNGTAAYQQVRVTITAITITGMSNGWTSANVLPLLTVENEMRLLRYFPLSNTASLLSPTTLTGTYDGVSHSDQLAVAWTFPASANTNISQIEYAWVENETKNFYNVNGVFDPNTLFWINSTRIDVDPVGNYYTFNYNVPLIYPADPSQGGGTLYYRVRAVLKKNDGSLITGPWTSPQIYASPTGHQPNLNWQCTTNFAENAKSKTVIKYFDGSFRARQTVTKDNSTGNTVVSETIYDLQGRPNVQILPTPTLSTAIQYFSDFNRFGVQTTNDNPARYFDLSVAGTPCTGAPRLDTTRGNGQYYSSNNPWIGSEKTAKLIPDAGGYGYSETRYADDPTERVSVEGGLGSAYQIGSGHETKYYYGKPTQNELDALFGTEAGDASHYFKNMVQDVNGQMSVAYSDMHGRTVATALAGNTNGNLTTINNNTAFYPVSSGSLINNLLTPATNIVKGDSIESISTILVPARSIDTFVYQLNPAILQQLSCNSQQICFDCKYNLEISIRQQDCGGAPALVKHFNNLQIVPANQSCGTSMGFIGDGISSPTTQIIFYDTLAAGSWIVRKTLSINDSLFKIREDSAVSAFLCKSQQNIIDSVFAAMSASSNCNTPAATLNCTTCQAQLGTYANYKANYLAGLGGASTLTDAVIHAQYSQDSLACADACGTSLNPALSTLGILRTQLLNDMIPYAGQYAIPAASVGVNTRLEAKYNIFMTSYAGTFGTFGTKPFYKNPVSEPSGAVSFYSNPDGTADIGIYPNGNSADHSVLNSLSTDSFATIFNRNWASQLIWYHPEYSKLHFAETTLASSFAWLDNVMNCNSYANALANGYLSPLTSDPYFSFNGNLGYVPTDRSAMSRQLTVNVNPNAAVGNSIWRLANSSALCDTSQPLSVRQACLAALPSADITGIDPSATTPAQKDAVWRAFRSLYLGYRNDLVMKYIDAQQAGTLTAAAMTELQAEGKQLRFATAQTQANQNGWTWWSTATNPNGVDSVGLTNLANTYLTANTLDQCVAQRPFWQARLQQCEVLQQLLQNQNHTDSLTENGIISVILDSMVMVCHHSINSNNPSGASNVNPALLPITPADFEDIVNHVFAQHGIATLPANYYFCNPYSIDYPKPFNTNPPVFINIRSTVDTCNCKQFESLKSAARIAGFDTTSYSSMNSYLLANYSDTLTFTLWQGLQRCNGFNWFTDSCYWRFNTGGGLALALKQTPAKAAVVPLVSTNCNPPPTFPSPVINNVTVSKPLPSAAIGSNQTVVITYTLPGTATGSKLNVDNGDILIAITGTSTQLSFPPCGFHTFFIVSTFNTGCIPPTATTTSNTVNLSNCWTKDSCVAIFNPMSIGAASVIPAFLNCGYVKPCISCATLQSYTAAFRLLYPAYGGVPYTSGGTSIDTGMAKQNALWARYLNYRTGFSKTANEYAAAFLNCGLVSGETDLVLTNRSTQPPSGATPPLLYTASNSITFSTGFASLSDDNFQTQFSAFLGSSANAVCALLDKPVTYVPLPDTTHSNPCQGVLDQANFIGTRLFQQRRDSLKANFDSLYRAKCLGAQGVEVFYAKYAPSEYHYTLYYYDQAGNLLKTLPPAAVKPNFNAAYLAQVPLSRAVGADLSNGTNTENMATQYRYNTINQTSSQKTPDGGISHFWYDRLGRLAVSQNAKQLSDPSYSYTLYDILGRITEVGQKPQATSMTQTISQDTTALKNWLNDLVTGGIKQQITRTIYDLPYPSFTGTAPIAQLNLRNRAAYTEVIDIDNTNPVPYLAATFYSYDVHGNVDTLLQDYGTASVMGVNNNRFKLIRYDYDLISGKVNQIRYQPGFADAFYHQYSYDAENRVTAVRTSTDSLNWQNDATYSYYRHGPLARTQLGDLQVEGVDYAYTLQGWLKSINPSYVDDPTVHDVFDADGTSSPALFARDAYKLTLNYFDDGANVDYRPVGTMPFYRAGNLLPNSKTNLYNGNVNSMAVSIRKLAANSTASRAGPLLYNYGYDQLNRITAMNAWTADSTLTPTQNPLHNAPLADYFELYAYDPNGNILGLDRSDTVANSGATMIALLNYKYLYAKTGGGLGEYIPGQAPATGVDHLTNQLSSIGNSGPVPTNANEIKTQSSFNYQYDAIGNLVGDVQSKITSITWSVYGRILNITDSGKTISFSYDASGNRISKTANGITSWYVRDASGNVMSVYTQGDNTRNSGALTQSELHVYGNNRLGILNLNVNCTSLVAPTVSALVRGNKLFELANHLGNVLSTISDKKLQHTTDGSTVDYYNPDVLSANDYYSFGMGMQGRAFNNAGYRYGFNGKENDYEVKGSGNEIDYGMRVYDPRIGRFLSVDPLMHDFPHYTPYQFAGNMPIIAIDLDGAEPEAVTKKAAEYINTFYEWGGKNPTDEWKAVYSKFEKVDGDHVIKSFLINFSLAFKKKNDTQKMKIYQEYNNILLDKYNAKFDATSFGIDCSGLAKLAFNSDREKLMKDFDYETAQQQYGDFGKAQKQGKGQLHFDFDYIGQGDLIFDEDDKGVHHVMIATGNVRVNKANKVTKVEIIHAPSSGEFVKKEYIKLKDTYTIGHTYRNGDVLTPLGTEKVDDATKKNLSTNLENFKKKYQYVQPAAK